MSVKSAYVLPFTVKVRPVISTSAYTAGDLVGLPMQLVGAVRKSGQPIKLIGVNGTERGGQKPALSLFFFRSEPQPQTTAFADNAAPVFSSDTIQQNPSVVQLAVADWYVPSTQTPAYLTNGDLNVGIDVDGPNDPWLLILAESAYDAVNLLDLSLTLHLEREDN